MAKSRWCMTCRTRHSLTTPHDREFDLAAKKDRAVLVEYTVRILGPERYPSNEVMDAALATLAASLEYNNNLQRLIDERWIRGVDSLGAAGFTVEVEKGE